MWLSGWSLMDHLNLFVKYLFTLFAYFSTRVLFLFVYYDFVSFLYITVKYKVDAKSVLYLKLKSLPFAWRTCSGNLGTLSWTTCIPNEHPSWSGNTLPDTDLEEEFLSYPYNRAFLTKLKCTKKWHLPTQEGLHQWFPTCPTGGQLKNE